MLSVLTKDIFPILLFKSESVPGIVSSVVTLTALKLSPESRIWPNEFPSSYLLQRQALKPNTN